MLTRERAATISKLAYPIAIAISSNLLMMLVDLAMVGRLGNRAIAAVGLSVFGFTLVTAFMNGFAPAVQGLVARRRGENSPEARCLPLNGGLLAAVLLGVPLTFVAYYTVPAFLSLISSDPKVTEVAVPYLRMLYMSIVAVGINASCRGFWTAMEKPRLHMSIVLITNCLNAFLDYCLIFGKFGFPALGVTGAAIATVSALHLGVLINLTLLFLHHRGDGFLSVKPAAALLKRIFKLGIPATAQEFLFSAGFIVFLWLVGQVGTEDLAAMSVLVRISLVLLILANALGMASATLVSKSIGRGDIAGASQWGWDAGKLGVIAITLVALPLVLFPRFFLSIFFTDPHTIEIAVLPLQLQAATCGIGSLIHIFAYTLVSLGDGARVAAISFSTQWLLFLPAVWFVGPHLGYGILHISLVDLGYGAVATALITAIWAEGRWKKIRI